jgi:signal peptidase
MDQNGVDVKTTLFVSIVGVSLLLFSVTGPVLVPFSGVVSESMEPNINTGDMIVISALNNPNPIIDTTVYTAANNSSGFPHGKNGSVIVFTDSDASDPVIHRAMYAVDEGENWVQTANQSGIPSGWGCERIEQCPAPHDGYITKGDNNTYYDQTAEYGVVERSDVLGIAIIRIPHAGFISEAMYDRQQSDANT